MPGPLTRDLSPISSCFHQTSTTKVRWAQIGERAMEQRVQQREYRGSSSFVSFVCVFFLFSLFFNHTLAQPRFSGGEQRFSLRKGRKGSQIFFPSRQKREEKGRNIVFVLGEGVRSSLLPCARVQLCTTVFPDGEDAGRGRDGPPGAAEPADWQGEGDDPGLLDKSLRDLRWCWRGHTSQVFLSLKYHRVYIYLIPTQNEL